MMTHLPKRWVSIDPGDHYVGFAHWYEDVCVECKQHSPDTLIKALELLCVGRAIQLMVYEKFSLYAWNEKSMAGNEFLTSQLIGIIKYIGAKNGVPAVGQMAMLGKSTYKETWYKNLTRKEMRNMPWWGHGDHAKDAWAHGMYFKKQRRLH